MPTKAEINFLQKININLPGLGEYLPVVLNYGGQRDLVVSLEWGLFSPRVTEYYKGRELPNIETIEGVTFDKRRGLEIIGPDSVTLYLPYSTRHLVTIDGTDCWIGAEIGFGRFTKEPWIRPVRQGSINEAGAMRVDLQVIPSIREELKGIKSARLTRLNERVFKQ